MSVPWVRVADVLRRRLDRVPVEPLGTYRLLGVRNRGRGAFDSGEISGSATSYRFLYRAHAGDLVYLKLGAWERAFSTVPDELDGHCASSEFVMYEPDESRLDRRYLAHLVGWDGVVTGIGAKSTGTNVRRRRLKPEPFEVATIPLPDLPEQRRIAARLDAIAAVSAETGATAQQLVESIEARLLADVITDAPTRRFGDLLHLERRKVDVALDAEYREVGVRSFGRGLFIKDPITGSELGGKRVFRVCSGDLVISNIFAWEGAVALATDGHDGLIGSHRFMTWVPSVPEVDPCFVRHYLTSPGGVAALRAASPGSAGRNRTLGISALSDLPIPIPDISLQQRVNARFVQSHRVRALWHRRSQLGSALLPAARNEEFSRLTSA